MSLDIKQPVIPVPRRFSPSPSRGPDAGLRAHQHYRRRLPPWRYRLREYLIPMVRRETPTLARIQAACRTSFLDSYFAFTANLGTHTFYMTFLPICFWCGYAETGLALVHMLGLGVYWSGVLKDLVGLPRPLSPPLQRITMSGSAALEYGFPSTHTTNAVSVAIYMFHHLYASRDTWSPTTYYLLAAACCCYATSITVGRVYCGMHGFFDIIIGAILGAVIGWLRVTFGPAFDAWVISAGWARPALVTTILALSVRFHPEPADDCPCFDDSVAFVGVIMGCAIGNWHYSELHGTIPRDLRSLASMYPFQNNDLLTSGARLVGGIIVIFLWRATMKPLLLGVLPPTFRFIDRIGLRFPRRFFLQAEEYTKIPPLRKDDNVIPSATDIPGMLATMRNPKRRRISIGPQSEADARELIAQRREQRRGHRSISQPNFSATEDELSTSPDRKNPSLPHREANSSNKYLESPSLVHKLHNGKSPQDKETKEDDDDAREIFTALEKPRTHYDAEVITKLVVYAGIAWWAVEGNPLWFHALDLA